MSLGNMFSPPLMIMSFLRSDYVEVALLVESAHVSQREEARLVLRRPSLPDC